MVRQEAFSTVQVDLVPGASLRGTVVDDGGRTIPGVTVSVGNPRKWKGHVTGTSVETDADGRFEMHSLNSGDADVLLDAYDQMGGGATVCRVALLPGQVSECTLKLLRRDTIVVTVVDENSRPVPEAICSADEGDLGYWSAVSDGAGRLRAGVSGPAVRLHLSKTGYCSGTVCMNVKDRRESTVVLRREEPATAIVRGSVRSSVGTGVADHGEMSLVSHDMDVWHQASVSQSGAFEFLPVPPGRYSLVLTGQGSPGICLGPVLLEAGQTWDVGEQPASRRWPPLGEFCAARRAATQCSR